jgi:hypothetical protein
MPAHVRLRGLDMPAWWHAGDADVTLVLDDSSVLLLFAEAEDPSTTVGWLFPQYLEVRYGSPSTDDLSKHPMGAAGASHFGGFEVLQSDWLAERTERVRLDGYRHYFLHLGDRSLELIAKAPEAYTCPRDVSEALRVRTVLSHCAPLHAGGDGVPIS